MNGIDAILALKINIATILHHVNNIIYTMQEEKAGLYRQCGAVKQWHGKRLTSE